MVGRVSQGDVAPEFELLDQDGQPVELSDHAGHTVVLYFHPAVETPDSITQARGIRDHQADYATAGATVIGISPDESATLRAFADRHDLDFTLLSDPDHSVAEAYGVWVLKRMYGHPVGHGIRRSTFIVGADKKILWTYKGMPPNKHDRLVLKALRKLVS
jgi:peroxiredoxin Q/BCP